MVLGMLLRMLLGMLLRMLSGTLLRMLLGTLLRMLLGTLLRMLFGNASANAFGVCAGYFINFRTKKSAAAPYTVTALSKCIQWWVSSTIINVS